MQYNLICSLINKEEHSIKDKEYNYRISIEYKNSIYLQFWLGHCEKCS